MFYFIFPILFFQVVKSQIQTEWGGFQAQTDFKNCEKSYYGSINKPHPDLGKTLDQIINSYGYPVQRLNVVTEDGYILGVYRIPHGRQHVSPLIPGQRRKAVYLAHGLGVNSHSWLIQPYTRNLPFLLADSGLDVFIVNSRGTKYSQSHMDPAMGPTTKRYWDFSFHEMGVYDIPAVIQAMTNLTGEKKVYYVGHSMGGSQYIAGLSARPETNEKIATAFLLAPAATTYNTRSILRVIFPFLFWSQPLWSFFLGERIDMVQKLFDFTDNAAQMVCAPSTTACGICSNFVFAFFGYDHPQMNYISSIEFYFKSSMALWMAFVDTMASKSFMHIGQAQVSNRMQQFDYLSERKNMQRYGRKTPPEYPLRRITAPVVIYYGPGDNLVTKEDTLQLAQWIGRPAIKEVNAVNWPLFAHYDFFAAKDADDLLYKDIRDKIVHSTYG